MKLNQKLFFLLMLLNFNIKLFSEKPISIKFKNSHLRQLDSFGFFTNIYIDIQNQKKAILNFAQNKKYSFFTEEMTLKELIKYKKENINQSKEESILLKKILKYAVLDFLNIISEFIQVARNYKKLILDLLQEYKALNHNKHTYLEKWIKHESSENDKELLLKDINSFEKLNELCFDLVKFLHIFLNSLEYSKKKLALKNG